MGIVFRDGPSGRRAGLMGGPDVWEVVSAVRGSDQRGDAAIVAAARDLDLSVARVQTAVAYYGAHAEEIDAEIVENEIAADEALRAWRAQQQLLS